MGNIFFKKVKMKWKEKQLKKKEEEKLEFQMRELDKRERELQMREQGKREREKQINKKRRESKYKPLITKKEYEYALENLYGNEYLSAKSKFQANKWIFKNLVSLIEASSSKGLTFIVIRYDSRKIWDYIRSNYEYILEFCSINNFICCEICCPYSHRCRYKISWGN
jgi:hypothetical protein